MRGGIERVFADGGIEHRGEVRYGTCQRTSHILGDGERNDAGDAGQSFGGTKSDEVVDRRWDANGSASVGSHAGRGEAGRDSSSGAAAGTARITRGIIGIVRLPESRADRGN